MDKLINSVAASKPSYLSSKFTYKSKYLLNKLNHKNNSSTCRTTCVIKLVDKQGLSPVIAKYIAINLLNWKDFGPLEVTYLAFLPTCTEWCFFFFVESLLNNFWSSLGGMLEAIYDAIISNLVLPGSSTANTSSSLLKIKIYSDSFLFMYYFK